MTRYSKGARCERELLKEFHEKGYSVMRSAGSGINTLSPDLVVMKDGKGFAFECKAWESTSLSIENERFEGLLKWQENTKLDTFVAWRMSNNGWFFIKLNEMKTNEKNKTVTKSTALEINRRIEALMTQ